MKFLCDGREWDTADMTVFETGNRAMPYVYLSADGQHVFVQTMDRSIGVEIVQATPEQVRHLAVAYDLPALLMSGPSAAVSGDGKQEESQPPPTFP